MSVKRITKHYYSIFADGIEDPVRDALEESLKDVSVFECCNGLVVFSSLAPLKDVKELRFVRNSFLLLRRLDLTAGWRVETVIEALADDQEARAVLRRCGVGPRGTFRLIISDGSRLAPTDLSRMKTMERLIATNTGLRVDRSRPDHEFWLHFRSQEIALFSLRITKRPAAEQVLEKGELRPEIADILCRLSDPRKDELFLDPFAGSGAIPIARALHFDRCTVLASDADDEKVRRLKSKVAAMGFKKNMIVRRADALDMDRYDDGCIDKIVTDPPWGAHRELEFSPEEFHGRMLAEFNRMLRPSGLLVILMAREQDFGKMREKSSPGLISRAHYDILLSGRKATIHVMEKKARLD